MVAVTLRLRHLFVWMPVGMLLYRVLIVYATTPYNS